MSILRVDRVASPIGEIVLVADGERLCALDYADCAGRMLRLLRRRYATFELVEAPGVGGFGERVRAYFAGDLTSLDALPVSTGGTPFQQAVWLALRTIPAGAMRSYGALAAQLGRPTAARAVGMTNALNPISLALPCHRVVGADASLTGYAGGLERKRWLLRHEGADGER